MAQSRRYEPYVDIRTLRQPESSGLGSPWMRGTNENTNGLVRQYVPRGSDFSGFAANDLQDIEDKLNNRPRKRFRWATPAQVFAWAL